MEMIKRFFKSLFGIKEDPKCELCERPLTTEEDFFTFYMKNDVGDVLATFHMCEDCFSDEDVMETGEPDEQ